MTAGWWQEKKGLGENASGRSGEQWATHEVCRETTPFIDGHGGMSGWTGLYTFAWPKKAPFFSSPLAMRPGALKKQISESSLLQLTRFLPLCARVYSLEP